MLPTVTAKARIRRSGFGSDLKREATPMRRGYPAHDERVIHHHGGEEPEPDEKVEWEVGGPARSTQDPPRQVVERPRSVQGTREKEEREEEDQRRCGARDRSLGAPHGQDSDCDGSERSRNEKGPDGRSPVRDLSDDYRAEDHRGGSRRARS